MTELKDRAQVWAEGCRGESLSKRDEARFIHLANNRFHAFQMSASHAEANKSASEAETWIGGLIKGLARELRENPGLERAWQTSDYREGLHGKRVSLLLSEPT